jgi:hypothetical protein
LESFGIIAWHNDHNDDMLEIPFHFLMCVAYRETFVIVKTIFQDILTELHVLNSPDYKKKKVFGIRSRDSSVGIATDYELDGPGSIPPGSAKLSSSPQRPDRLWGPPSLLSNGYRGTFLWGKAAGA